ncbi:MAG: DNA-binding transcriptional regulator [Verrucomicrobia bacterium]|nr:DNA-binding transcriptional regulator [Verrucomicrobiota bacterium]
MALGWYDYRLHRGIEKYAQENDWHLYSNLAREKVLPWGWEGHGILAWLGEGDDLAEFVTQAGKPTVDLSFRRPELPFPRVLEDHAHAAQLVAEHFLSRGFTHFLFYSERDNWSYEERGQGFQKALKMAGHDCVWLRWHKSPQYCEDQQQWKRRRIWLLSELRSAQKPLAVFAANDDQAMDVLDACKTGGLLVPEEVAIMGAENYLLAAESMRTPISSVDTNLEALGYRAAALLSTLMKGKKAPSEPIRVPAAGIVTRLSSDLLAVTHKGVANSLRFIWQHFHEPIQVSDLVGAAFMSRRGLHKAFLQQIGRTPGQELQRIRIDRAKQLLAETDNKVEVVASMCGYQSANSLSIAFKQATGLSPKQYRDALPKPD